MNNGNKKALELSAVSNARMTCAVNLKIIRIILGKESGTDFYPALWLKFAKMLDNKLDKGWVNFEIVVWISPPRSFPPFSSAKITVTKNSSSVRKFRKKNKEKKEKNCCPLAVPAPASQRTTARHGYLRSH